MFGSITAAAAVAVVAVVVAVVVVEVVVVLVVSKQPDLKTAGKILSSHW